MLVRKNTIKELDKNKIIEYSTIKFQENAFATKINLRIDPLNKNQITKCSKILEAIVPIQPNTYSNNDKLKILWLAPNEWLIITNNENNLLQNLQNQVGQQIASVTDVSENKTVLKVSGNKLYKLLAKFLVLDLNKCLPNNFSLAQTLFVKVPIIIIRNHKNKEEPEVDIITNRSHSNYIYSLLVDGSNNLDF